MDDFEEVLCSRPKSDSLRYGWRVKCEGYMESVCRGDLDI